IPPHRERPHPVSDPTRQFRDRHSVRRDGVPHTDELDRFGSNVLLRVVWCLAPEGPPARDDRIAEIAQRLDESACLVKAAPVCPVRVAYVTGEVFLGYVSDQSLL